MNKKELLKKVMAKLNSEKCEKHPQYKGKGNPPTGCENCLKTYIKYKNIHPLRVPHRPTKMIPDKSKYKREKNKWDNE